MKQFVAAAVLATAAFWPLAHRSLVAKFDVNPWKLFGLAMYTTPTPPIQVVVFVKGPTGLQPLREDTLPSAVRDELDRFRIERHALGSLRRPDEVGPLLLEALPDEAPWVVIAVQRMILDRESALMRSSRERFVYERGP